MLKKLIITTFLLMSTNAFAHDWYPAFCCNGTEHGGDCHPVACDSITEEPNGNYTYVGTNNLKYSFAKDKVFPSKDSKCHACVSLEGYESGVPHCLFIQLGY